MHVGMCADNVSRHVYGHVCRPACRHVRRHACGHAHRYVTRHACELGPRRNHGHKLGDLARPDLVRASGADKKQCGVNPADRSDACAGGAKPRKTTSMNLVISYDAPTGEQTGRKHFGAKSRAIGCACGWREKYSKNREDELGDRARCHHEHELGHETFLLRASSRRIFQKIASPLLKINCGCPFLL